MTSNILKANKAKSNNILKMILYIFWTVKTMETKSKYIINFWILQITSIQVSSKNLGNYIISFNKLQCYQKERRRRKTWMLIRKLKNIFKILKNRRSSRKKNVSKFEIFLIKLSLWTEFYWLLILNTKVWNSKERK